MHKRIAFMTLAAMVFAMAPSLPADEKDDEGAVVKRLTVKGVRANRRGRVTMPTVLKSSEELAKAVTNKDALAAIKKEVDFEKQNVVVFAWAGSGQDRLSHRVDKKGDTQLVVFEYSPGRTRDLRQHVAIFLVAKKVKHKVESKRGR